MKFARLGGAALALALIGSTAGARAVTLGPDPVAPATSAGGPGLTRLLAGTADGATAVGIARFGAVPSAATVDALRTLGLDVQGMAHLPLAIVRGPVAAMQQAVTGGLALDVYPDERLQLLDTASTDAMGGAATRAAGLTGKGVTVGIVDSGCDATHADLHDRVVHNVKVYGPEYVNQRPDPNTPHDAPLTVAQDFGPGSNTDLGSGHGTHVAGIIAADGHTGPDHLGVAPAADLVCYSIGEVLFTTAVVSAYDNMLDQPDLWGIDVVNNSWGNSFQQYDPDNPVNVATKAVADKGVVVVFAAGNAGSDEAEISLNPFSQAPWLISAAAGDVDHVRGEFSSNGIEYDNSQAVPIAPDGHTVFTGSRIGIYHPDVTGPGVDISSTCDHTGSLVGPCPAGDENTEASGTSMASPHIAGAAAVLKQANPRLTVDQVRSALQSTATPVARDDEPGVTAPFWQVGYGYVDLGAAARLVQDRNYAKAIAKQQGAADARVLSSSPFRVRQSDVWAWASPPVTLGGAPDSRTLSLAVPVGTKAVKAALAYPSANTIGTSGMSYTVTVADAAGKVLGTSEANPSNGTSTVLVTVPADAAFGTWTFAVTGDRAVSDPDTIDSESALGRFVTLAVAQLVGR